MKPPNTLELRNIYCPTCKRRVVSKSVDGFIKVRTRMIYFDKLGKAKIVCKNCGGIVPIDIRVGEALIKALGVPRLTLKARR